MSSIEINNNKIMDWLVSHRNISSNWSSQLDLIRSKINAAVVDMPENDEFKNLVGINGLSYNQCVAVVDILKKTESHSKNIFGYYSSKRMKDWQAVLSQYEKENLRLAEMASSMLRIQRYEIPATLRQIEKTGRQKMEASKRQLHCEQLAESQRRLFEQQLNLYSIPDADNIRRGLQVLVANLPEWAEQFHAQAVCLKPLVEVYLACSRYFMDQQDFLVCSNLSRYLEEGNISYFEWLHHKKPTFQSYKPSESPVQANEPANQEDEIDFSVDVDDLDTPISLDIGTDELHESTAAVLSVLEVAPSRLAVLQDLRELEGFVRSRLDESRGDGYEAGLSTNAYGLLAEEIWAGFKQRGLLSLDQHLENQLSLVCGLLHQLTDERQQHRFSMRQSMHYLDSVVARLEKPREEAARLQHKARLAQHQLQELGVVSDNLSKVLAGFRSTLHSLKEEVAAAISQLYSGVPVYLLDD